MHLVLLLPSEQKLPLIMEEQCSQLRVYIGGGNVFNADAPIFQLVKISTNLP